jgi:uncharacterized delta-60 repeat protein
MMKKFTLSLALLTIAAVSGFAQINIQWASRYTSAGSNIDRAIDLDRDTAGNVIVTGTSWNGANLDIVTVKYDPAGNQLWAMSFNGSGNGFDDAHAIDVDDAGNSYVTGFSESTGSNYDIITIKYDAAGAQQWAIAYNGSANGFDEGNDVIADANGNVYVTGGEVRTTSNANFITIKYNAAGTQQWATQYSNTNNSTGSEAAYAIDLDAAGNVYVTGTSYQNATNDHDLAAVKYNNAGVQQWVRRFNGAGSNYDAGSDIAVEASTGSVFICGYTRALTGITNYDAVVMKYNAVGTLQWTSTYAGPGNDYDRANRLLIQSNGNVAVTGRSVGTVSTAEDMMVLNYNGASGTLIWERRYDGGFVQWDEGKDITADNLGNLYITGFSYNTGSNNNYITFKYDSLGTMIWMVKYNGPANNSDQSFSMFVDTIGNIYLTGVSKGAGTNDDFNTIKYCQLTTTTTADTTICMGDDVQLGASSSFGGTDTIVYSPATYLDFTDPLNPVATPPVTTTYIVALTNIYGCTDYDTVTINVVPLPGPQIQSTGPLGFCQGDSVTLTAVDTTNGGAGFLWSTTDTTQSITVSAAGVYSVIITDTNSCQSQSQVTITVYGLPTINAGNDTGFCTSSSITLCATGGVNYAWAPSFGVSDTTIACPTFGPTSSVTYTVTGTDANGCSNVDSITLSLFPLPSVPVISQNVQILTSTPALSYQWYFNNNPIPGATNQTYTPTQNGSYYVVVTDSNGCSSFSSTYAMADVGIQEVVAQGGISMYPNPSNGTFFLVTDLQRQPAMLEIISVTGQLVYSEQLEAEGVIRKELNAGMEDGSYLVRVTLADGNVKLGRVVIAR